MLILAHLLNGISVVLGSILSLMTFLIIARAVLSWVRPDPYNPIVQFLNAATDPLLRLIRRYVPLVGGGLDISPIVALLAIYLVQYSLVPLLVDYALQLRTAALR